MIETTADTAIGMLVFFLAAVAALLIFGGKEEDMQAWKATFTKDGSDEIVKTIGSPSIESAAKKAAAHAEANKLEVVSIEKDDETVIL